MGGNGSHPKGADLLIIDDIEGETGLNDSGWFGCVAVDRDSSGLTGVDCVAAGSEQARTPKEFVDSQNFSILHDSRGLEPIPGIADAVFKSEKSPYPWMGWGLAIWMGVINYDNDERISADFQTKKRVPAGERTAVQSRCRGRIRTGIRIRIGLILG